MVACTYDSDWAIYLCVSVISIFVGLVILLPLHIIWRCSRGEGRKAWLARHSRAHDLLSKLRMFADGILSGNSITSKIIMIGFWVVDLLACTVYLAEAILSDYSESLECHAYSDPLHYVWIAAMALCLVRFVVKFFASAEKLHMWVDLFSLVDHFTIGPTIVGIVLNKNWLGLRFLRLVYLLKTPDVLQLMTLLRNSNSIRVAKAVSTFLAIWVCGACTYHILENSDDENNQLSVGYSIYFVLISLTTIGYGDYCPKTVLGRSFTVIFVVLALATFCTLIADMGKVLSARTKYRNEYRRTYGKRHIVICGGITFETLTTVVKNFIHEDSPVENTDLVIIDVEKPSAELRAFFRRNFNDVTFIQGTVLDMATLKLAKVQQADVVLILANRMAEDQDEEDAANIMRAAAIKNVSSKIRIIIQLLQHHNKEQLLHIPSWNWHSDTDQSAGDEVVCISELKMGFMAQNCLAPGIVTILSNLICMRSFKEGSGANTWLNHYGYGAGHEIYAGPFNNTFHGLTFTEAAVRCMTDYGVLLIAVRTPEGPQDEGRSSGQPKLRVNPGNKLVLQTYHIGIFIAQDPTEVERVAQSNDLVLNCELAPTGKLIRLTSETGDEDLLEVIGSNTNTSGHVTSNGALINLQSDDDNNNEREMFDRTNMYHWCLAQPLEDVLLDSDSVRHQSFSNHVIFVLSSNVSGKGLGLANFVKPLRASSILANQLKPIVFYAEQSCIEQEWKLINNFPKVFVYPRTRSIYADLRHLNVHRCAMCLVLGKGGGSKIDDTLVDKSAILTTKNIISLQMMEDKIAKIGVLANPDQFRQQVAVSTEIPMLIELEHDTSVPYIDDDDDDDPNQPLYQTTPYACGRVLLASVLDSLVATAYISQDVLTLVRALLTGGETNEFETVLAERVGIVRRGTLVDSDAARRRSTITLINLSDHPLSSIDHQFNYGHLMVNALRSYGILCIGLYRLLEISEENQKTNRFVITHPPCNFELLPSDKVYALKPYEFEASTDDVIKIGPCQYSSAKLESKF